MLITLHISEPSSLTCFDELGGVRETVQSGTERNRHSHSHLTLLARGLDIQQNLSVRAEEQI